MGKRKGTPATVSRLRAALGTLIGVRECLVDALEFADRGIETARRIITEQTKAEAPIPISQAAETKEEILSLIDKWRKHPKSWVWIAAELNKRGYRTFSRNKRWSEQSALKAHTRAQNRNAVEEKEEK